SSADRLAAYPDQGMDAQLRRLEQRIAASPHDGEARARLRVALCRIADLNDRRAWQGSDEAAQDRVLAAIARLLAPAFEQVQTTTYAAGGQSHRIGAFSHVRSQALLHLVPGDTFTMGQPTGHPLEGPPRQVHVPPLLIGRYPLLQREWDRVGGVDTRQFPGEDRPIEGVSWNAVQAWLKRANGGLRLPSEAEWEYTCRAGTTTAYFWGDAIDPHRCWYGEAPEWETHPPELHADQSNAFGLVDVSGNVFEWCQDGYRPYAEAPADGSACTRGRQRILRGGAAFNGAASCQSARRFSSAPRDSSGGIGFRLARSLPC
ncbi:formylglycine-generating enzyme family protein, partial [Planctomycetota bacterium]|nr:formylglycine-generating enzyme family protein [Planctomycetota bacterium]